MATATWRGEVAMLDQGRGWIRSRMGGVDGSLAEVFLFIRTKGDSITIRSLVLVIEFAS